MYIDMCIYVHIYMRIYMHISLYMYIHIWRENRYVPGPAINIGVPLYKGFLINQDFITLEYTSV